MTAAFRTGALRAACLCSLAVATIAAAQPNRVFDIGSGGQPTITGASGGAVVVANPSLLSDLVVTVNLGEISPANANATVRVVVPIAIRSAKGYQVRAFLDSATFDPNPLAIQRADIGVGVQNLRPLANGRLCNNHIPVNPFNNDPATSVIRTNRAVFPSSLNSVAAGPVILEGPRLSSGGTPHVDRLTDNGWVFDAVFAVVPQFFLPGTASFTIRFNISESPANINCN